MKNQMSSSERKGIILIAIIALAVIGAGLGISIIQSYRPVYADPEVEIISNFSDSVCNKDTNHRKSQSTSGSLKSKKKKSTKTWRRRSPLDEPV